jgi:uncharacterized OB-fold protein
MLEERRHSTRRRTFKAGRIVFDDKRSVISCTVVNMSENGANMRLPSVLGVADTFELHVGDEVHAAWVVWKTDGTLGVMW